MERISADGSGSEALHLRGTLWHWFQLEGIELQLCLRQVLGGGQMVRGGGGGQGTERGRLARVRQGDREGGEGLWLAQDLWWDGACGKLLRAWQLQCDEELGVEIRNRIHHQLLAGLRLGLQQGLGL
jgi:hypothetical protein